MIHRNLPPPPTDLEYYKKKLTSRLLLRNRQLFRDVKGNYENLVKDIRLIFEHNNFQTQFNANNI